MRSIMVDSANTAEEMPPLLSFMLFLDSTAACVGDGGAPG